MPGLPLSLAMGATPYAISARLTGLYLSQSSAPSQDLYAALRANWPVVTLVVVVTLIVVAQTWIVLPKLLERALRRIDEAIPGDFSALHRSLSRLLVLLITLGVVGVATIATATALGYDTTGATGDVRAALATTAGWLLPRVGRVAVVFVLSYVALRIVRRLMPHVIQGYLGRRTGEQADAAEVAKRTQTLEGALQGVMVVFLTVITVLIALSELEVDIAPLLAGAGVVGIAVGFGAQTLIRDIISGAFIILEDQYRVGDVVTIAGIGGLVEDINLRRTVLRDLNYVVHSIPNGEVRVSSNMTKEKSRAVVTISVAYKEDLDRVISVLNQVGREMFDDPALRPLMNEPLKVERVDDLQDSGVSVLVMGETKPIQQWTVMGQFRKRVKEAFDREGIEIPFPHRTVYWRRDVGPGQDTSGARSATNGGRTPSYERGSDEDAVSGRS